MNHGGIEFTRNNEHRIASFDTLLEQEDKYTEIFEDIFEEEKVGISNLVLYIASLSSILLV